MPTPPDSPPEGWAEGSKGRSATRDPKMPQEATQAPKDEYDGMTPDQLAEALRAGAERTRLSLEAEAAELERDRIGMGGVIAALPTPDEIRAKVEEAEKIEMERARRRAARIPELQRIKRESWVAQWARTHARFSEATLDQIDPANREKIEDWIDSPSPGTLLFSGGVGTGKTYGAFAVMRELYLHNLNVQFWPVPKLLDALRPNSGATETVAEDASMVDVLTLDDIGAERPTDWSMERLYILVNDRWMAKRRTIVTTNLDGKTLRESIGDRMYSRLIEGATFAQMGMTDRRKA